MTCLGKNKQGTEILLDYCAGSLDQQRAGELENHALECAACRELIAAQKSLWSALDQIEAPEISADFDARLYARIAEENAQPMWRIWWDRISFGGFAWKPVLVVAAAAVVLLMGLSLQMTLLHVPIMHAPASPDASQQIRPESVDVEQLEVTLQDLEMLTPPSASNGKSPAGKM